MALKFPVPAWGRVGISLGQLSKQQAVLPWGLPLIPAGSLGSSRSHGRGQLHRRSPAAAPSCGREAWTTLCALLGPAGGRQLQQPRLYLPGVPETHSPIHWSKRGAFPPWVSVAGSEDQGVLPVGRYKWT